MGISLTGLVSGLDTAQMVSDLMDIERIPYTNLKTKKTNLQSEQTIFRSINTKLSALETAANALRNPEDFSVHKATSTDATVLKATAASYAKAGSYNLEVTKLASAASVTVQGISGSGTDLGANLTSMTIGGKTIDVSAAFSGKDVSTNEKALTALSEYINANSSTLGLKAEAFKTDDSGKFALTVSSTSTGLQTSFDISATGVTFPSGNIQKSLGSNAEFKLNGVNVSRASNSFDDLIKGLSITLTKTGTTTVDVNQDTDNITTKIETFVKAYNDLLGVIKDNLAKPTTEGTINPLQGDSLLKNISSQMYNIFTSTISGSGSIKTMEQIGLSIDKGVTNAASMTGKITFDKEKFASVLDSNSNEVTKLFTNDEEGNKGIALNIASTIRNNYTSTVTGLLNVKITGYDSEIKMVDDRLSTMDLMLEKREARLKQQFSTMETLLSSLKSQQSWLTSQFEALTKSSS